MQTQSDQIDQLAAALVAFQAEMPTVAKNRRNPFFNSNYADLADIVQAATPVLTKNGLGVVQLVSKTDNGSPTLKTIVVHSSGQFIGDECRLYLPKEDSQGQGAAVTYARRISYAAALGIVSDEDGDGNVGTAPPPAPPQQRQAAPAARQAPQAAPPAPPAAPPRPAPAAAPARQAPVQERVAAQAGQGQQQTRTMNPANANEACTPAQNKAIWGIGMRGLGLQRDQVLEQCAFLIGHEVADTNDLTRAEAGKIIETFKAWEGTAQDTASAAVQGAFPGATEEAPPAEPPADYGEEPF